MRNVSPVATLLLGVTLLGLALVGCGGSGDSAAYGDAPDGVDIMTDTSFLSDIVQNVAGQRLTISPLISLGADPHSFEPTPKDAQRVAECRAVVVNVTGLLPAVDELVSGAGGAGKPVIEAARGISGLEQDPHCWLDPLLVVTYADNIAAGLAELDPAGSAEYRANARAYGDTMRELDSWIKSQVDTIPVGRRLLVTDHESLGRFASRYGFEIVGTLFPTPTGEGSASARQLAALVADVEATGAPAIFVETGSAVGLAEQIGAEAGVKVVTDLNTHSLTEQASTYVDMMRWNVTKIVEALR